MTPSFRVLTFVTDDSQRAAMRASFEAAGFTEGRAVFTEVDNTLGNAADPYGVVNAMLDSLEESYLIVCHQDVRLDRGAGFDVLVERLASAGDRWAVAGPAGLTLDHRQALAISDPWDAPLWNGTWPVCVQSLDELLIVLRPGRARLTDGLTGFHFYGVDLCLSARRGGWDALAINFPLTHLSDGRRGQQSLEYERSRTALQLRLSPLYSFRLVVASTGVPVVLSRHAWVRNVAGRGRVVAAVKAIQRRRHA